MLSLDPESPSSHRLRSRRHARSIPGAISPTRRTRCSSPCGARAALRGAHRPHGRRRRGDARRARVRGERRRASRRRARAVSRALRRAAAEPHPPVSAASPKCSRRSGSRAPLAVLTNKPLAATRRILAGLGSRALLSGRRRRRRRRTVSAQAGSGGLLHLMRARRRRRGGDAARRRFDRRLADRARGGDADLPGAVWIRVRGLSARRARPRRTV